MELQEGDLVFGKVESISNNVVFVTLEDNKRGTIISSEIASGRIKNLREYVVPNKQIVCKVLRISNDGTQIDLSLRRVSSKEKKEVLQEYKQTQTIKLGLKQILKEDFEKTNQKIEKDFSSLKEFIEKAKQNESVIKKYIPSNKIEQVKKITEKRKKQIELIQKIKIKCLESDGIKKIKNIFSKANEKTKINYISAGNFMLKLSAEDFKQGKQQMQIIVDEMQKSAKQNNCEIDFEEIKN